MITTPTVPYVDSSYWNTADGLGGHVFDPDALASAGVRAVLVRAGRGDPAVKPGNGVDEHAHLTVDACRAAGLPWFPYWRFMNPASEPPAYQVRRYVTAIRDLGYAGGAPVILDIEAMTDDEGDEWDGLEPVTIATWLLDVRAELAELGVTNIGVYTGAWIWDQIAGDLLWGDLPLFVSHYLDNADGTPAALHRNANMWDERADELLESGPILPVGWGRWDAWQSAGAGSGVGHHLGYASEHVPCGLIRADRFDQWFGGRS